jgi:hypothetical protein
VGLLAVSGVLLYHRFYHAPFHVTRVAIPQPAQTACKATVLGHIDTNGAAGTVSYEWVFGSAPQAPQRGKASATANQRVVTVKAYVQGSGHGTATQTVTLRVLSPDPRTTRRAVVVRC